MSHKANIRLARNGLALLLSLALLSGCAGLGIPPNQGGTADPSNPQPSPDQTFTGSKVAQAALPRQSHPPVSVEDQQALEQGNQAFAMDFYQAVRSKPGNIFFSPYSLSLALAMTYAGAAGETQAQMAHSLHFDLPPERLHPAFNALDQELAALGDAALPTAPSLNGTPTAPPQPFRLQIANSLWGQQDFSFRSEFLDLLAQNYGAGLRLSDFAAQPEVSRQEINTWVSQQTEDRIQDLIPSGAIDRDTRLVLANAIYFKADWEQPFEKSETQDADFHLLDGGVVRVPMMTQDSIASFPYLKGQGFQAVELPYVGQQISMVIIVPDEGTFNNFEASLGADSLEAILQSLQPTMLKLWLPKFTFKSQFDLVDTFRQLGMTDPFDPDRADFSGIDGRKDLYIGGIFHQAFVAVDEKGTEAAAATAVIAQLASAMQPPTILQVDRPFIFLIQDRQSGALLFVGRVLNPMS